MKRILIANRGEIACRIIRSCKKLGLQSIAVYSDIDKNSKHVREADESIHIGGSKAQESYLLAEKIIEVAKKLNADAIHPGYGFMAENAEFAQNVIDSGIIWIGPKPSTIISMGNKDVARDLAIKNNLPICPGLKDEDLKKDDLENKCNEIGYPILIKASAGGGGIGMRIANNYEELIQSIEKTKNLAKKAFGNSDIFLEKFISNARHIEIQVFGLGENAVSIVGHIPKGLPEIKFPEITFNAFIKLFIPALLISIVGYVETVSIAQTLAAKRREKIEHNQELIALGFSNFGSGLSGGFPVTGGFARSVVNFDAGAKTPAAGAFTAIGIAVSTLFLTSLLFYLPKATLAATIIIAVLSLVDFKSVIKVFSYSKTDGLAMVSTIVVTLCFGVEIGIVSGVVLSLLMFLYRTSKPHIAKVGQVPGTEHYRNEDRHIVISSNKVICLRIDESLYFPNARFLEDSIYKFVINNKNAKHIIIMCSAVNYIDSSALESLEFLNSRLNESGVKLHLSEVKGPVMDQLKKTNFLDELTGEVFLTNFQAFLKLEPKMANKTLKLKN